MCEAVERIDKGGFSAAELFKRSEKQKRKRLCQEKGLRIDDCVAVLMFASLIKKKNTNLGQQEEKLHGLSVVITARIKTKEQLDRTKYSARSIVMKTIIKSMSRKHPLRVARHVMTREKEPRNEFCSLIRFQKLFIRLVGCQSLDIQQPRSPIGLKLNHVPSTPKRCKVVCETFSFPFLISLDGVRSFHLNEL